MNYRIIWLFIFMTCLSIPEKKMVLVMPSYNNAAWYQKNLDSVFSQNYENWHIIYIDDASTDGTLELVRNYVKLKNKESKVTIIANSQRRGALANHYFAVHMCEDWDIVTQLDGDDWFAHKDVLSYLNDVYDDQNIWMTYGSFIDWPTDRPGYSQPLSSEVLANELFRETYWTPGQLRTFYAWLFKKIKLEDFLWDHNDESLGKFYPAACDLAFSYPLIEMAGEHYKYISDLIYIHNIATPINDYKVNRLAQIIASNALLYKKKYQRLKNAPEKKIKKERSEAKKVDIFVFNHDPHLDPKVLLDSCRKFVDGMHKLFLIDISEITITEFSEGEKLISRSYDSVRDLLLKELHNWWKSSEYVLFLDSRMKIHNKFNARSYIDCIEEAQAYAYFPSLRIKSDSKNSPFAILGEKLGAWKLCLVDRQWMRGSSYFNILIHKKMIRERITYLNEDLVVNTLLKDLFSRGMLMIQDPTITRIGLCGVAQDVV